MRKMNFCPKTVTPYYLPKVRESAAAKPHQVNAPNYSRNSHKESYGSNDMVHAYFLEDARKMTQDKTRIPNHRDMASTRAHCTPNACLVLHLDDVWTKQFKPRSSSNDVWTKQFKPRSSSNDVWTKQFKPRSSSNDVWTKQFKPRSSSNDVWTKQFKPRSSSNDVWTKQFKPRSSSNDVWTKQFKPRSSSNDVWTKQFKPRSSSNDVWTKQFKPRSSSNDVWTKQFKPRSSSNDVWTKQFKPRSSSNDVWTKQFKPRSSSKSSRENSSTHARIMSGPDPEPMQEEQPGSNSGKLHIPPPHNVSLADQTPEHRMMSHLTKPSSQSLSTNQHGATTITTSSLKSLHSSPFQRRVARLSKSIPQEKAHKRKHDSDDDEDDDDDEGPSARSNQGKSGKRRRHDSGASESAQPPTNDDEQSSKKPRKSDASASKQHPALPSTRWKITDTRIANVDSSMHRSDPELEQPEQSSDNIPMQDEGHVFDLEDTDNAHIPKVSTTTWFKPIPEGEGPAIPKPEWTIPPNDFLEPENNWANTYATTYQVPTENKLQRKTYDIRSFIKWFCRRTGKKKLCKADLEDVDSEHFVRDDNTGDDNEETKPDPEEIYNRAVQFLKWSSHGSCANQFRTCAFFDDSWIQSYYNLPPRTVSPDPVAIVASRAVDPVGSPSSTTIDQDEQSTSTSPTNQEIQSQVTHQGLVPQLMAPDHSSSGPVLHEMMSDHNTSDLAPQRQEMSVENVSLGLVPQGQKASDYDNSDPMPLR
ncbi:hypothetical protein Tco_1191263 [Tanacetum coccineum]